MKVIESWQVWTLILGGIGIMIWNAPDTDKHTRKNAINGPDDDLIEEMKLWRELVPRFEQADKVLLITGLLAKAGEYCDNAVQSKAAREYSVVEDST